ncbi:MAG: hypothetical protein M1827_006667 [Pycnora praestabilis]|nr:MAG: hypothetical protein M1827_006667 [Pycnora praestabilis]
MAGTMMLALGLTFILSSLFYLALSKRQRDIVLNRIHLQQRRTSGASTPPLTLSPEKAPVNVPAPDYKEWFPESRREALAEIAPTLPEVQQATFRHSISSHASRVSMIPMTSSWRDCPDFACTPTDFSVQELKALGDFPDYSKLSGVPLPGPYHKFDINKALPRPYRPFRWTYHQTMALTKMEPDWWLELEKNYVDKIAQRKGLFKQYGKAVLDYLPGSDLACKELMEMALQFLCARYPQYFTLSTNDPLSRGNIVFQNRILGSATEIKAMHPLHVLLNNVPEDFAIMLRNHDDGFYYFRAGIICSSLGWNVGSKIGMQLQEIHQPIPDYKEKMQFSMDRFFSKMPTEKPIQRGSWGLEIDTPLFMPPGDPHEAHREVQHPDLSLSRCHLRVDWQTLRRLPLSAAIVFNFKALFTPVEDFRDEPYIPALCVKVLKEGKRSLMQYKNTWHVEHVVVPALEKWEKEQVEQGIMKEGWEAHTLDESPWYPGWEERWHREQGF